MERINHARKIAEKFLKDGDGEAVKEAVSKLANDDDEYNKLICLCRYYVRDPWRIEFSKEYERDNEH